MENACFAVNDRDDFMTIPHVPGGFTSKSAPEDRTSGSHEGTVSEDALLGCVLLCQTL